jgi:hypothetical protein
MLRHYVSLCQTDWLVFHPCVEFAINNSVHEITRFSPFYLVHGQHPVTPGAYGLQLSPSSLPAVSHTTHLWQSAVARAKRCLHSARDRMASYLNRNRKHLEYLPGQVLLSTRNLYLALPGTKKFLPKYVSPLTILELIGPAAVRLQLPDH